MGGDTGVHTDTSIPPSERRIAREREVKSEKDQFVLRSTAAPGEKFPRGKTVPHFQVPSGFILAI